MSRLIDADEFLEKMTFVCATTKVAVMDVIDELPTIEPNLVINPDEVERGDVVEIGENIVVMHHDDYYDMFLKSELYDDISCEDAISRADALKFIDEKYNEGRHLSEYEDGRNSMNEAIYAGIESLPSVAPSRPSGEWIPCSERLPDKPYGCLVTVWDSTPTGEGDDFENLLPYFVGWDGEQWNDGDGEQCPFEVIAWMPLPEPYKENE